MSRESEQMTELTDAEVEAIDGGSIIGWVEYYIGYAIGSYNKALTQCGCNPYDGPMS